MRAEESNRGISTRARLGMRVAALFVCTVGCSKTSPGDPSDLSDPSAFCDAYLKAELNHQVVCSGGSSAAVTTAITAQSCGSVESEVSSGSVSYDPVAASACLDELPVLPCWQSDAADYSKVFTGTIPEGGTCFPAILGLEECVPETRCVTNVQCPGVCTGYAQLGEACSMDDTSSTFCANGLTCAPGSEPECVAAAVAAAVPTPALGTPCSWYFECQGLDVQLTCEGPNGPIYDPSSGTAAGTCQPPRDDGPCLDPADCRSGLCVGGNEATAMAGVCMPPKVAGDACTPGLQGCGPGTYCGSASVCVVVPSVGQSCAVSAGTEQQCLDGVCDPVSLTCVPFGKLGDRCQVSTCSFELVCDYTRMICVPGCFRGSACGASGQACCNGLQIKAPGPGGLCNSGLACVNAICAT